ncbi:macrolide transporter subunit MacA [compost metagenome]
MKQISGTGSIAANSRETVTAGKSGTIATVNVKKGDKVKAGQILATFEDTDDYDDQIESIQKNITKLQESIQDNQEKYKEATGTENEESAMETLRKSIEEANSEIADYQSDLKKIYEKQEKEEKSVMASVDGEITEINVEAGDEVQANTTVASIVDYTLLEFVTSVDELDILSVKVGQAVDITLSAITDRTIDATVSEIAQEGTASNGSSAYQVSILLNDIESVKVGMSGEAAITIESKEDIVLIPVNAVVEMGGRSFIRVPSDGSAQTSVPSGQSSAADSQAPSADGRTGMRERGTDSSTGESSGAAGGRQGGRMPDALGGNLVEVTTGLSDENFVEIVSGLSEGDSVLVPVAQGAAGMGSQSTEGTLQQGGFPGGGGMSFPSGGFSGGGGMGMPGGGGMR